MNEILNEKTIVSSSNYNINIGIYDNNTCRYG